MLQRMGLLWDVTLAVGLIAAIAGLSLLCARAIDWAITAIGGLLGG